MGRFDKVVDFQVHLKLAGIAIALGLVDDYIDSPHNIRGGHGISRWRI